MQAITQTPSTARTDVLQQSPEEGEALDADIAAAIRDLATRRLTWAGAAHLIPWLPLPIQATPATASR